MSLIVSIYIKLYFIFIRSAITASAMSINVQFNQKNIGLAPYGYDSSLSYFNPLWGHIKPAD